LAGTVVVSAAWVLIAPAIIRGTKASFLRVGLRPVEAFWEGREEGVEKVSDEAEFIRDATVTETPSHDMQALINTRSQFQ